MGYLIAIAVVLTIIVLACFKVSGDCSRQEEAEERVVEDGE